MKAEKNDADGPRKNLLPERRRWLLGSVALFGALSLVATWISSILASRARSELLLTKSESATLMVQVVAASIAASLDFGDDDEIRAKLDQLHSSERISYGGVWRVENAAPVAISGRGELGLPAQIPGSRVLSDALEIAAPVNDPNGRHLGDIVVGFSLSPELARDEATRWRLLPGSIALAAVISALLSLAWRGLRRRLERSDATEPLNPGDTLGHYQLLTCVGQGGMGKVWAARRIGSPVECLVAIKTAIRVDEQSRDFRDSFADESRIAALIRHPNVCGAYEFGEHLGVLYQVMEWCDGISLRQALDRLPERRLDANVAARLVAQVAAGLHAAHQLQDDDGVPMRVVHRDVSPQNILISRDGHVKVTDFGVAKARGQIHRTTATGIVKGKMLYMSPEQVKALPVDHRSDIFSLGCVLYEATVGQVPFGGDGELATLYQLVTFKLMRPDDIVPGYPVELSEIVLKALAQDPRDRYQTAEVFAVALQTWLGDARITVTERKLSAVIKRAAWDVMEEKARRIRTARAVIPQAAKPIVTARTEPPMILESFRPTPAPQSRKPPPRSEVYDNTGMPSGERNPAAALPTVRPPRKPSIG